MRIDFFARMAERQICFDPATMAIVGPLIVPALIGGGTAAAVGAFSGGKDKSADPTSTYTPPAANTGAAKSFESVEAQAAQRRLARLSKYFSSPTGVLGENTGAAGVF